MEMLLSLLLRAVWPGAPSWLAPLLAQALPEVVELVRAIRARQPDAPKRVVIDEVVDVLDVALDQAPWFVDRTEAERDAMIGHLAAVAGLVLEADEDVSPRTIRDLRRGLRAARVAYKKGE